MVMSHALMVMSHVLMVMSHEVMEISHVLVLISHVFVCLHMLMRFRYKLEWGNYHQGPTIEITYNDWTTFHLVYISLGLKTCFSLATRLLLTQPYAISQTTLLPRSYSVTMCYYHHFLTHLNLVPSLPLISSSGNYAHLK